MASSKCALVMEGTGSGASSSMLSGFSIFTRSRSMSFSMFSLMAYLQALYTSDYSMPSGSTRMASGMLMWDSLCSEHKT